MPRAYLIEGIFPANEISFVFGSPGAGKSSFICTVANCIIEGKPFKFDGRLFNVNRSTLGYAAFDRSHDSIGDLLAKYGLDKRIQWRSYRNVCKPDGSDQKPIHEIPADFPNCSTLILDGLGLTIPTGKTNDYCTVGNYVRYCGTVAETNKLNMIGTLHAPKPRLEGGISNPRMGALGSTAFPGIAEAMIQVEHVDLTNPEDPNRVIRIMPHDGPALQSNWAFNESGILVECPPDQAADKEICITLLSLLPAKFSSAQAVQVADSLEVSRRSTYRYISEMLESGKITQIARGWYTKQLVC